jgi:hypothetical protein
MRGVTIERDFIDAPRIELAIAPDEKGLPRFIHSVAWEKYRKSWMQYFISNLRIS